MPNLNTTIAIIGAGPAGMLAALQLAKHGYSCALFGPPPPNDQRTTALMMPSIKALEDIALFKTLKAYAAPLKTMRLIDDTHRLLRASSASFYAHEIGETAFGYNLPNYILNQNLLKTVKAHPLITYHPTQVNTFNHHEDRVDFICDDDTHHQAALVIAADGKNSRARAAAGIKLHQWNYPQTAIVFSFSHSHSHQDTSTEFHTQNGPFTQIPLKGQNSSLVWVTHPKRATELLSLGPQALAYETEMQMHSLLGKITLTSPPQAWPLSGGLAKKFAANRTLLLGEAAHALPPIGAQGLNLGIRDGQYLAKALTQSTHDFGDKHVLRAYHRYRQPDIWTRSQAVNLLNRALLSNLFSAQMARYLGLELLRHTPPLRRLFMHEGMAPGSSWHALTQTLPSWLKNHTPF
ncbi:UbiH/UbiF family hydroxylase [Bartonella sp. DGB2]|uniref:UbiH/UbiF family hydroxylase n=1 Tax=Bartonella sp. DGB2 TaxID=3388426 RepID=UPI00399005F5